MGTKYGPFYTDGKTNALQTITYPHHEVHGGNSYHLTAKDTSMGDGDTIIITFTTPATPEIHMTVEWAAKVAGHLELISGNDAPTGGTAMTAKNDNANSDNVSAITDFKLNPTVSGGTTGDELYAFGARNFGSSQANHDGEAILKASTKHTIKFTADGATNGGFIRLSWYEHTALD